MEVKILLLGASGKLGIYLTNQINNLNINLSTPTHKECPIENYDILYNTIKNEKPNIIIHAAGYVNTEGCENDKQLCLDSNVLGTFNVAKICRLLNIKLVFISSEYVFGGDEDEYTIDSKVNPKNTYGISKACGEFIVKTLDNYLVIRAPFIRDKKFPYEYAFKDQFTSRQYVHQIIDKIIDLSLSNKIGIKHIVGKYQSVYNLAKQSKSDVKPINTPEKLKNILPMNLNLK